MAGNVDNRIVQMSFENRQFERNIAKSKKSLDELKKSMNFDETSKGLDKFSKGLNGLSFSSLENNIQKLTDKFTGLGTASELIISQVRRHIESAARRLSGFIDSMTTAQVSAGMSKYEMLNKSVQTIKAATGRDESDVYRVLERLNQYTDQTSYNFSDMAQNIGKFTSVGIKLEDAEKQMEGIANWAARSGAGINEASRAMYNLSQAMGVGKMTLIDWKSIENAGMATKEFKEQLIQAGLAAGTLVDEKGVVKTAKSLGKQIEVNYQNISQSFQKGWATSGVISNTLEKYYYDDLYYEHEQEAILQLDEAQKKSFDEMVASGKKLEASEWKQLANMGVITQDTKQKILDLAVSQNKLTKETDKDGKTIYKTVNKTGKKIEFTIDNIEESLKAGWFDEGFGESVTSINELAKSSYEAAQKCLTFSDVLGAWKDQISTGWMNSFKLIFGELSESMEFFSDVCNRVGEAIDGLISIRNGALQVWADAGGRKSLVSLLLGDTENGVYGVLDFLEGAGKLIFDGFKNFALLFGNAQDKAAVAAKPEYFATYLGYKLSDAMKSLQNFFNRIGEFFNGEVEYDGKVKSRLEVIGDVVKGIAGALQLGYQIITKALEFIGELGKDLTPGLDSLLEFFADLGRAIYGTADEVGKGNKIKNFFDELREILAPVTDGINKVVNAFSNLLYMLFGIEEEGVTYTKSLSAIGNIIKSIAKIISGVAGPILNFLSGLITLSTDLFKNGFSTEGLTKFAEGFKTLVHNIFEKLPDPIKKIATFFKTLYTNIKNVIKNRFSKESTQQLSKQVSAAFSGIIDKVPETLKAKGTSVLDKIKAFFTGLWTKITELFSGKKNEGQQGEPGKTIFDRIIDWIKSGYESVKTFIQTTVGNLEGDSASFATALKNLNWSKILLILFGGLTVAGIATLIAKAIGTVKLIAKAIKLVGDILTGEKSIAPTLFGADDKTEKFGDKLLKIAGAVAIFAAAIILIGNMKLENAAQGIGAMILILGMLVGASFLLKRAYKDVNWQEALGMLFGMVGMAIAISTIAKAILPVANLSLGGFGKIIGTLVVIFGGLILLSKMAKDNNTSFSNMGGLLAVAAGIAILIFALRKVADMKPDQLLTMGKVLFAILAMLAGFVWAVHKTSLEGKELGQLAAVAGAIAILIIALKMVANMKWEQLGKMGVVLTVVLGELIGFVWAVNKANMGGKSLGQLAALAGAIAIIMLALIPLSLIPFDRLMGSVLAVSIIMWELVGVAKILDTKDTTMAGLGLVQLLAVAGAVVLISLALIPLSLLDFGKMMGAVLAVTVMIGALIGMVAVAGKTQPKPSSMVGLLAVAGAVALLVIALTPLALMDWDALAKMGAALLVVTGSMMLMLSKISKVNAKAVSATALLMGVMSLMILAFGSAMHNIKDLDWKLVASFAVGLGIIIGLIAVSIEKLAKVDLVQGLKAIALLTAAVAAILLVVSLIGPLLIKNFGSALADMSGSLSLFATLIGDFTTKMGNTDEGGIDKAGNVVDRLIDILKRASAITQYKGAINEFQTAMYQLGTAVEIFNNHTNGVGNLEGNAAFGLISGLASCANDLDTIVRMPLNTLQGQIAGLGAAMSLYAQGAKEATGLTIGEVPDVSAALTLMHSIADAFAKDDKGFEIPDNLPEDQDVKDFGVSLAVLAGALVQFGNASQGLGTDYKKGLEVLTFFRELQQKLQSDEWYNVDFGVINEVNGKFEAAGITGGSVDVLDQFGANIEALGSALSKFANATSRMNEETKQMEPIDFSNGTKALQAFIDMKEQLPDVGGVWQWFAGEKESLTDLGSEISAAAGALGDLSARIAGGTYNGTTYDGFKSESVDTAVEALKKMAKGFGDLEKEIESIPGAQTGDDPYGITAKESSITSLANQMSTIGPALNLLSVAICGGTAADGSKYVAFNSDSIEPAQKATKSMIEFLQAMQKDLPTVGGLVNIADTFWNGRQGNMEDLKIQLGWLGEGLNSLSTKIGSDFNPDNVKVAIESLNGFAQIMATMTSVPEGRIFDGFELLSQLSDFLNGFNGFDRNGDEMNAKPVEKLVTLMSELSDLVLRNNISADAIQMFLNMAIALNNLTHADMSFDFTSVGENISAGLALGIRNGTSEVVQAAIDVVKAAKLAADETADNRSPSHVFQKVGAFLSAGMAVGITQNADMVAASAGDLVTDALGAVSRALAEGADANPTITPVLDLTNLEKGMGQFRDSLGGYGLGLDTSINVSRVGGYGTAEGITITPPDYSGIYSHMEALGEKITQMESSIMKMKLVLDTGVLAGGVSDRVDEIIGQKIWLLDRNNTV